MDNNVQPSSSIETPLQVHELNYYHDEEQEEKANQECNKLRESIESEMQGGGVEQPAKPFPSVGFLQKLSEDAYKESCKLKKPWLQLKDIYCKDNNLRARIFLNSIDRQLVIAFRGSNFCCEDFKTNYNCVLKGGPADKHCNSAATVGVLARDILEKFNGRVNLILTGHSLGGYLAQLAAFTAQNLQIIDGKFQTVDHKNCIEIYPHTVVFDSPAAAERILQSTFVNPVGIENLRLDVTNYIKCGNMINNYSRATRHLGRIIFAASEDLKSLKYSYWPLRHSANLFGSVDNDDKCEVVDLNNLIAEPLDEYSIPLTAFSKREYDALQILPLLQTLPSKTELILNFTLYQNSVKIFNEKPESFVPRVRLFLLENRKLFKDPVQRSKDFQDLIAKELWKFVYQDFQDLNILLDIKYIQVLLSAESDVHIKCNKPLKEKIILAQMIRNSIPNTYYLTYKQYKKLNPDLIQYFLTNFKGRLILLLDNNETFETRKEDANKTCKFIMFANNAETKHENLKMLENVKVEIVSKESKSLIENKRVNFFGNSILFKELFEVLPNEVDLIEILDFALNYRQHENVSKSKQFYVIQQLVNILQENPYKKITKSIDDLIGLLAVEKGFLILSSGPGMGKTTFFSQLQAKLTNNFPNFWIVKISLLEQSHYLNDLLKQTGKLNINHVVDFIKQSEQSGRTVFQMRVLEYLIKSKRVVVILDAFDEICPLYRKIALRIIGKLKSYKISFAISTRPQELEQIQKRLNCKEHFELLEIDDLGEFFKQYFIVKENLDDSEAKSKADSLKQFSHNIYRFDGFRLISFWKIPLHALMAAELYAKSDSSINMNNLFGLFDQFVEKRISRDLQEKMNLNPIHPKQFEEFKNRKKNILKWLMLLALRENFTEFQEPNIFTLASIRKTHIRDINYTGIANIHISSKVQFSHHTFAEYLCIKYCLEKLQDEQVLRVIKQVMLEPAHWMKRKFLNEMVANCVWPELGTFVQENSNEVLVRICKDDLVEVFHLLKRSGVSFAYDIALQVVQSQDISLWEAFDLPSPTKRARTVEYDSDYVEYDFDDGDSDHEDEYHFGHFTTFPLSLAIINASEKLVLELIKDGADLSKVLNDPKSCYEDILSHAILRNMGKVVAHILRISPLKNEPDYEELCMMNWAVRSDNLELVNILFEAGASVTAADKNGITPLNITKNRNCNQQIIEFIEEKIALTHNRL